MAFALWFAKIESCHNISAVQVFQNLLSMPNEPDVQLGFLLKFLIKEHKDNVSGVNPAFDFSIRNNSDPVQIKKQPCFGNH
ncbi:MAG: hypothetical protein H8D87_19560 [Deltaproteobacteria bacterium]|nr:hypothetical protein [Candidatus Desulfobacula maris]